MTLQIPYPTFDADPIYDEIAARLVATGALTTVSRDKKPWSEVDKDSQPAAFVSVFQAHPEYGERINTPPAWRLTGRILLYARRAADKTIAPGTQVNALIEVVEGAFMRTVEDAGPPDLLTSPIYTTLGGLCQYCRISDVPFIDEGNIDDQIVVLIEVDILALA